MGQKDMAEKLLFDYNDVFADIINGFIFEGEQRIKPEQLRESKIRSQYKANTDKIHEQERDILKEWTSSRVCIAICGIENQTEPDKYMPLRILNYDGVSYRSQLLEKRKTISPVVTIVLYLGTEKRWGSVKKLKDILSIPKGMEKYVNDYKINIFEVAWMDEKDLSRFKSDFRIFANILIKKRKNKNYVPDDQTELKHFDEVLKLLKVVTDDKNVEQMLEIPKKKRKGVKSMFVGLQKLIDKTEAKGIAEGKADGMFSLVSKGIIPATVGAEELGVSVRKFKSDMKKKGYTCP